MCEFELPDVSLRCFVATQLLLRIYALSSVKFQDSNCGCVKNVTNMKYGGVGGLAYPCSGFLFNCRASQSKFIGIWGKHYFSPWPESYLGQGGATSTIIPMDEAEGAGGVEIGTTDGEAAWVFLFLCSRPNNFFQIFLAACFNWNRFYCKSPIYSWPYSTCTQIYVKSETGQRISSKYFVSNNVSSRKWEWKIRFGLISLMQLFKGESHIVQWFLR